MKHATPWSVLCVLCVLGTQGRAQGSARDGDLGCVSEPPTAAVTRTPIETAAAKPPLAQLERCPDVGVDITAAPHEERNLACSAVDDAVQLLGRCDIPLRRTLHLQIRNEVRHPFSKERVLRFFDTRQERVLVTQEALIASLVEGTAYGELPQRDFYRSLIVHEVVHGIMHQNLRRPATNHAAYEYPTYVLQVASLPADKRKKLLRSIPNRARSGELVFNDANLFFDPSFFAVHAYEHFKSAANGCAQLHALLNGEAFLPNLPP